MFTHVSRDVDVFQGGRQSLTGDEPVWRLADVMCVVSLQGFQELLENSVDQL
jgi:hypothetical protein